MTVYYESIHENYNHYFEVVYQFNMTNVHLYKSVKLSNFDAILLDICLFENYRGRIFKNILKSNIRICDSPDDEGKIYENSIKELKISLKEEIKKDIYILKIQLYFFEQQPIKFFIELDISDEFKPLKILNDKLIIKKFNIAFMEFTGQEIRQMRSKIKKLETH